MTTTTPKPIKNINQLIERLEDLHTDLDPRHMNVRQYEHVGWARRSVETLLDQCREEAKSIRWVEQHSKSRAPRAERKALGSV